MLKAKFDLAKQYISAHEYDKARAILRDVDHPTARAWEAKIDVLSPRKPDKSNRVTWLFLAILLLAVVAYVGLSYFNQNTSWAAGAFDTYLSQNSPP